MMRLEFGPKWRAAGQIALIFAVVMPLGWAIYVLFATLIEIIWRGLQAGGAL